MSCQPHLPNTAEHIYACRGGQPLTALYLHALVYVQPCAGATLLPEITPPSHRPQLRYRTTPRRTFHGSVPSFPTPSSPPFPRDSCEGDAAGNPPPSHTHFPLLPPLAKIPVTLPFPSFPPLPTPAQAIPFNFPRSSPLPSRVRGLYSPPWIVGCDYSGPGEGSPRGVPCAVRWRLVALMVSFPILVPIFPFYLPMDSRVSGVVCNLGANFADVHFIIMQKNINAKLCMLHLALIPYCTRHSLSV